jgi:hypothetical protein
MPAVVEAEPGVLHQVLNRGKEVSSIMASEPARYSFAQVMSEVVARFICGLLAEYQAAYLIESSVDDSLEES